MPNINTTLMSAFDADTLALSFSNAPYAPGKISERDIFMAKGIDTTTVSIEQVNEGLTLVASSPRGGIPDQHPRTNRDALKFKSPHLRTVDVVRADSWQDRRGIATGQLANVENERDRILTEMKGRLGATLEYHRARAFAGQVLDKDGSVLIDLLAEFDVSQATYDVDLDNASANIPNKIVAAKRLSEQALGATTPKSWVCFASASFIDALRAHPSLAAALQGWSAATAMRDDIRADFAVSNVQFLEMPDAAGVTFVEDGAAYLVPEGVPGLLVTYFSPADYMDQVNAPGQQFYTRAEMLPFNRGVELEAQVNPVNLVTKPRAVIKLTA